MVYTIYTVYTSYLKPIPSWQKYPSFFDEEPSVRVPTWKSLCREKAKACVKGGYFSLDKEIGIEYLAFVPSVWSRYSGVEDCGDLPIYGPFGDPAKELSDLLPIGAQSLHLIRIQGVIYRSQQMGQKQKWKPKIRR